MENEIVDFTFRASGFETLEAVEEYIAAKRVSNLLPNMRINYSNIEYRNGTWVANVAFTNRPEDGHNALANGWNF